MRRADGLFVSLDQLVVGGWLFFHDVQRRPGDLAAVEALYKGRFLDGTAPAAVDNPDPVLELRQVTVVNQVFRLVGQRHVDGDEVGHPQQLVNRFEHGHRGAFVLHGILFYIRIVSHRLHPETGGAAGHFFADTAQADDTHGLGVQLGPLALLLGPTALFQGGGGGHHVAGHGQGVSEYQLSHTDGAGRWSISHDHALVLGVVHIDVVQAYSAPDDEFEISRGIYDRLADLGGAAHHAGVILGNRLNELLGAHTSFHVHLFDGRFGPHFFDGFVGGGITYQYLHNTFTFQRLNIITIVSNRELYHCKREMSKN